MLFLFILPLKRWQMIDFKSLGHRRRRVRGAEETPWTVIVRTDEHAEDEDQKVGRKAVQADGYWKVPSQPCLRTAHFDEEELEAQTPPGQGRRREGQRNEPFEGFPAVRSVRIIQCAWMREEVHSSNYSPL